MNKNLIKELVKTKYALTGALIGLLPGKFQEHAGAIWQHITEALHEAMGEILKENNPAEGWKNKITKFPIE